MYTGLTACGYNWHMDADAYSDKLWHTLLNCHRVSEAHCTMQPHVNAAGLISHNQSDPLLPVQIDIINTIQQSGKVLMFCVSVHYLAFNVFYCLQQTYGNDEDSDDIVPDSVDGSSGILHCK